MTHVAACATAAALCILTVGLPTARADDVAQYRGWIEQMKQDPRGPFDSVKWFCKDGTVLPPAAYACQPHGGGHQHGQWSDRTRRLRAEGYYVANLLAGVDPAETVNGPQFTVSYQQFDSDWRYQGSSRVPEESEAALEVAYQVDINRDGRIG